MFIALVGAPYTGSALRYFIQIGLVPFAIALFLMNLPWRPDRFFQIARLLTAVATIVACIAVVEQLTGINLFSTSRRDAYLEAVNHFQVGDLTRAGGVFGQPDWLGGYITLFIAFPIGFAIATRNPFSRLGWISSEMFLLSALLASGTRLALLGSAVSLLAFVILGSRFRAISRPVLFLCITAIITVGSLVLVSPDVEPLNRLNVVSTRLSSTDERDVGIRLGAAVTGLRVAAMHPVQGIGLDYERYMDASIGVMDPRQIRPLAQPHNSYIELAAFAGYPALLAIVLLITRYTSGLWRGLKTPECVDPIRIALFSSVIGFLFSNMLVNLLTLPAISYCFWALLVSSTLPRFRENTHFPDTQSSRF
jgi:O-antigen ligase